MGLHFVLCLVWLQVFKWLQELNQTEGAEWRILVPGCDGVGGSAGEPCLPVCCVACLFRVGRGLLALPSTK